MVASSAEMLWLRSVGRNKSFGILVEFGLNPGGHLNKTAQSKQIVESDLVINAHHRTCFAVLFACWAHISIILD
jgi:hypothetical protein